MLLNSFVAITLIGSMLLNSSGEVDVNSPGKPHSVVDTGDVGAYRIYVAVP